MGGLPFAAKQNSSRPKAYIEEVQARLAAGLRILGVLHVRFVAVGQVH